MSSWFLSLVEDTSHEFIKLITKSGNSLSVHELHPCLQCFECVNKDRTLVLEKRKKATANSRVLNFFSIGFFASMVYPSAYQRAIKEPILWIGEKSIYEKSVFESWVFMHYHSLESSSESRYEISTVYQLLLEPINCFLNEYEFRDLTKFFLLNSCDVKSWFFSSSQ